jgi:hypothetical protein
MASRWAVVRAGESVTLERAWGAGGFDATVDDLDAWFGGDDGRVALLEACQELERVDGHRATTAELLARVAAAIERGDLRVVRAPLPVPVFRKAATEEDERPAERAAPVEEKTWIAIRLVDDQSPPKPVAFRRYRIELPDGTTREGMLDGEGMARLTGIDPGACKVTFPGLDKDSWSKA